MHQRTLIRRAVKKMLLNKTRAGARVYLSQSTLAWDDENNLPVILIYPLSESAELYAMAPRELRRTILLNIECIAAGPEDSPILEENKETVEDILDAMSTEIECELSRDDTLDCTADDIIQSNTEFEYKSDGSRPIGSMRITFNVTYHKAVPEDLSKQAGIEDFKKAHTDWHVGHDDEEPDLDNKEAEDDVDIPQT